MEKFQGVLKKIKTNLSVGVTLPVETLIYIKALTAKT